MLRILAITLASLVVIYWAWNRDWFTALCAAIVSMAFMEGGEVPKAMFGIPGFNFWNIICANVFLAWRAARHREGYGVETDAKLKKAVYLYLAVIIISFCRLEMNLTRFYEGSRLSAIMDYLINPLKFLVPAYLLYQGCNSLERAKFASKAIVLVYVLLALMTIRFMGLHLGGTGDSGGQRAAKIIGKRVGFHRVELSTMLAGGGWAVIAYAQFFKRRLVTLASVGVAGVVLLGQALTAGRTGYVAWALVGITLCSLKWRKVLPLIPIAGACAVLLIPSVRERVFLGLNPQERRGEGDAAEITSGRTTIWPYVIAKIKAAPLIGYGRLAMVRTGTATWLLEELNEVFAHPHNAYLEMLLDNGIIGFLAVSSIYIIIISRSASLFLDRSNPLYESVGGISLALTLALLYGSFGAQTLYPREGMVFMWAAIGLTMRVYAEREKIRQSALSESQWLAPAAAN